MRYPVTLLFVAALASPALADAKPTAKDVETTVRKLQQALGDGDGSKAKDPAAATALVTAPLTYKGFTYGGMDDKASAACKKKFGAKGTVKSADLGAFFDCHSIASWAGALDGDADWSVVDLKKLSKHVAAHKAQLTALAKDHVVVVSHFQPAGPAEHWNFYAAKTVDGVVKISAIIVVNVSFEP